MLNRSEIFKKAHANAKAAKFGEWANLHVGMTYAEIFAEYLLLAWKEVRAASAEKSPELVALEFEHMRRDRSDRRYFGSAVYRETKTRINQLRKAA